MHKIDFVEVGTSNGLPLTAIEVVGLIQIHRFDLCLPYFRFQFNGSLIWLLIFYFQRYLDLLLVRLTTISHRIILTGFK